MITQAKLTVGHLDASKITSIWVADKPKSRQMSKKVGARAITAIRKHHDRIIEWRAEYGCYCSVEGERAMQVYVSSN